MAKIIKKAQGGKKISLKDKYSNTADSLNFESRKKVYSQVNKELKNFKRSSNLDEDNKNMKQYNELAAKKFKKDPDMINSKKYRSLADKTKMKNGGSLTGLKASNKRVGPVDPKGAYTKVQKKTLAGAKGKASLTKDKQLGATKMAKCGTKMSKK